MYRNLLQKKKNASLNISRILGMLILCLIADALILGPLAIIMGYENLLIFLEQPSDLELIFFELNNLEVSVIIGVFLVPILGYLKWHEE